jgi:hypothetical protein
MLLNRWSTLIHGIMRKAESVSSPPINMNTSAKLKTSKIGGLPPKSRNKKY